MFTIVTDYIADPTARPGTNANAVGVVGPRSCKLTAEEIVGHPDGKKFRMRDDDGESYYEGVYVPTPGSDEFEPLDCFGRPNAGCTTIEYWIGGKDGGWKAL
jgi:hypothetical protein